MLNTGGLNLGNKCCPGSGDPIQCDGFGSISSKAALGERGPSEEEQCHPHWPSPLHCKKMNDRHYSSLKLSKRENIKKLYVG